MKRFTIIFVLIIPSLVWADTSSKTSNLFSISVVFEEYTEIGEEMGRCVVVKNYFKDRKYSLELEFEQGISKSEQDEFNSLLEEFSALVPPIFEQFLTVRQRKYAILKLKNSHDSLKSKIDLELKNGTKVAFRSIEDAMSNCRDFILNTTVNLYKNGQDVGNLISKYYN